MSRTQPQYLSKQRGVGLIEVLITVVILSIGLLGVAALQARALQENQSAVLRTQANILAYDILERMRSNRAQARKASGGYNISIGGGIPTKITTPSSADNIRQNDLHEWCTAINTLPQTSTNTCNGRIVCDAAGLCAITVQWLDKAYNDDRDGNGSIDDTDKTLNLTVTSQL